MATQFTVYRSTDASAPVLDGNGATNNLINLLHKILVAGYGSKSGAGWTEPFTNTSTKGVWKGGSGTKFFLRVLDDGSMTGGQRDTSVRGGENMSDIDTFSTNAFPSAAQQTNGLNWRKSTTVDGTARPWVAVADDRTLYLMIQSGDGTNGSAGFWPLYMFGEYFSYKPADTHNGMIIGAAAFSATAISFTTTGTYSGDLLNTGMQSTLTGHYAAAAASGSASIACAKKGAGQLNATNASSFTIQTLCGALSFPNAGDGGLYLHPVWIMDCTTPDVIHGEMRGFWHQCHPIAFFHDDDTIPLNPGSTKTFLIKKSTPQNSGSVAGSLAGVWTFETSATLRSN